MHAATVGLGGAVLAAGSGARLSIAHGAARDGVPTSGEEAEDHDADAIKARSAQIL